MRNVYLKISTNNQKQTSTINKSNQGYNPHVKGHWFIFLILVVQILIQQNAYANKTGIRKDACTQLAKSHYEHVFCKIKIKTPQAKLPNFNEFKKNPSDTQYLLLKRHAKKLGIILVKQTTTSTHKKNDAKLLVGDSPTQKLSPAARNIDQTVTKITYTQKPVLEAPKLNACSLTKETIKCKNIYYRLKTNLSLSQIKPSYLKPENQLNLTNNDGNTNLRKASQMYGIYIEKMLSIGLAYSTMSFTKFFSIYEDSQKQGLDFSKRMFKMFELLKQERKKNSIKERYDNDYPASISACMELNPDIIVCDNKKQNWVYTKTSSHF